MNEICQYTYVPSTGEVGPITCKVVSTKIGGNGGQDQDPDSDGSGGGGDPPPPPPPDPSEKKPCENVGSAIGDPTVSMLLNDLAGKTKGNYEIGYGITKNADGSVSYNKYNGAPNEASLPVIIFEEPIEGFLHSHYDGGTFPIFSPSDCLWMFQTYSRGSMSDPSTFSMGLVTSDGGYFLSITDMDKFIEFGVKFIDSLELLEGAYNLYVKIGQPDAIDMFAKFLKMVGAGMTLTTTDKKFENLKSKEIDPKTGKVKTKDC